MSSLKLFFKFLGESSQTVFKDFSLFFPSYIAFFVVGLISSIPWQGIGFESNSPFEIFSSLFVGIVSLIIIVNVILVEKSKFKHREKEQILYAAPTYLIYTLYSSILILLGPLIILGLAGFFTLHEYVRLGLAVIPGVVVAVFVGLVPLASVLIDNDSVNYFKVSYKMARQNVVLIFCFGFASLLVDAPSFAFDFISDWPLQMALNILYSIFDSAFLVVLTATSVRIFFHLKYQLNDPS